MESVAKPTIGHMEGFFGKKVSRHYAWSEVKVHDIYPINSLCANPKCGKQIHFANNSLCPRGKTNCLACLCIRCDSHGLIRVLKEMKSQEKSAGNF